MSCLLLCDAYFNFKNNCDNIPPHFNLWYYWCKKLLSIIISFFRNDSNHSIPQPSAFPVVSITYLYKTFRKRLKRLLNKQYWTWSYCQKIFSWFGSRCKFNDNLKVKQSCDIKISTKPPVRLLGKLSAHMTFKLTKQMTNDFVLILHYLSSRTYYHRWYQRLYAFFFFFGL